jgi:hypothetical protein
MNPYICPYCVLGNGTLCTDGVPTITGNYNSILNDKEKIPCRAWNYMTNWCDRLYPDVRISSKENGDYKLPLLVEVYR